VKLVAPVEEVKAVIIPSIHVVGADVLATRILEPTAKLLLTVIVNEIVPLLATVIDDVDVAVTAVEALVALVAAAVAEAEAAVAEAEAAVADEPAVVTPSPSSFIPATNNA
jgi:hypothetical protein